MFGEVMGDSVLPVWEAGLVDLVDSDHRITDEVRLEPTPGHTPGHHSVVVESKGERAVITGDMTHSPIQFAIPDMASHADTDGPKGGEDPPGVRRPLRLDAHAGHRHPLRRAHRRPHRGRR